MDVYFEWNLWISRLGGIRMTEEELGLDQILQDMVGNEPPIPPEIAMPNNFKYRRYNQETKRFVDGTNDRADSTDEVFATTEVALPDGDLNWVFREDIQMWKGYTADQLDAYLESIYVPVPTTTDEWQMAMIKQNALLIQQNMALTQTASDLTMRVNKLEKGQTGDTNNG